MTEGRYVRQRAWQIARLAEGMCSRCGSEPLYRDERCLRCYLKKYLGKRGLPEKHLDIVAHQLKVEFRYAQRKQAARMQA